MLEKGVKKIKIWAFVSCLAIIASVMIVQLIIALSISSPYEYVCRDAKDSLQPSELVWQTTDGDFHIVIYRNVRGTYSCAVVKKTLFSYKALDYSGHIGTDYFMHSGFPIGEEEIGIYWGITTDPTVTAVKIGGDVDCHLEKTDYRDFQVFWSFGNHGLTSDTIEYIRTPQ